MNGGARGSAATAVQGEEGLDRLRSSVAVTTMRGGVPVAGNASAVAAPQAAGAEAATGEEGGVLCDRCFQPITAEHASRCVAGMEEDVRAAEDALRELQQASHPPSTWMCDMRSVPDSFPMRRSNSRSRSSCSSMSPRTNLSDEAFLAPSQSFYERKTLSA